MATFLALPGFYQVLFLYLEPVSTILPAVLAWTYPGAKWFHQQLIPATPQDDLQSLDARTTYGYMATSKLLISSLVFRAVRDALPQNPQAQERIVGASLAALAIADVTHIGITFIGLPSDVRFAIGEWNNMTHGNITFVIVLLVVRLAWFMGIGRKRYIMDKSTKSS
ncbi:hypothetical protein F5887DRAFT_1070127 [Amanita rubescens]|nr:hypothetical protein F5887DRAFT_1070127 [Amanita rubescens]